MADTGEQPASGALRLTHIGGPTTLIEVGGWRILTDPTFDAAGEHYTFGWGTGSTKLAGPAIGLADLGPIDAVLLTHDHHADNLDEAGRALLADVPIVLTTTAGASRLGRTGVVGLEAWSSTTLDAPGKASIDVVATPCRHGPPLSRPIVGAVVGFALSWDGQEHGVLWISGDTVLYPGLWQVPDRLDVDVAILHLGGVQFPISGPLRYTMTIHEAVDLCDRLHPRMVIPVHYEGWSHFQQGRAAIEHGLAAAPSRTRDAFHFLELGHPTEIVT